jgi:hypothetical protein
MTLRFIDFKTNKPQNPPGGQVSTHRFAFSHRSHFGKVGFLSLYIK